MDYRTEIEIIIKRIDKVILDARNGINNAEEQDKIDLMEAKLLLENLECLNKEE